MYGSSHQINLCKPNGFENLFCVHTVQEKSVRRPELFYPVKGLNNHEESKA